jgi:glycerate kinase
LIVLSKGSGVRVLIASDKFKHSLTSEEVASHLTTGLLAGNPDLFVESIPIADGGEGTVKAALSAGFEAHTAVVSGPTGQPIEAVMAIRGHEAIIEVAAASGLAALANRVPAPLQATSLGTGQLIVEALDLGCTSIYIGAGGSACTDGGAGLLEGLGAKLLDSEGTPILPGGAALARLAAVDLQGLDPRLGNAQFVLASDVDNPLLGEQGCAAVFGPQKGATAKDIELLEIALSRFVDTLQDEIGPRAVTASVQAGAGAAGGIGYAALAVLRARFEPGVELVGRMIGLEQRIQGMALVITGEGSLDAQSLGGKAPMGVSNAAARAGVPVVAVCGRNSLPEAVLSEAGFTRTYALTTIEADEQRCMSHAGELLESIGETIANELLPQA